MACRGGIEQARSGEIKNMTGIGSPYEAPLAPELVLDASGCSVNESSERLLEYLRDHGYLCPPTTDVDGVVVADAKAT